MGLLDQQEVPEPVTELEATLAQRYKQWQEHPQSVIYLSHLQHLLREAEELWSEGYLGNEATSGTQYLVINAQASGRASALKEIIALNYADIYEKEINDHREQIRLAAERK